MLFSKRVRFYVSRRSGRSAAPPSRTQLNRSHPCIAYCVMKFHCIAATNVFSSHRFGFFFHIFIYAAVYIIKRSAAATEKAAVVDSYSTSARAAPEPVSYADRDISAAVIDYDCYMRKCAIIIIDDNNGRKLRL